MMRKETTTATAKSKTPAGCLRYAGEKSHSPTLSRLPLRQRANLMGQFLYLLGLQHQRDREKRGRIRILLLVGLQDFLGIHRRQIWIDISRARTRRRGRRLLHRVLLHTRRTHHQRDARGHHQFEKSAAIRGHFVALLLNTSKGTRGWPG